MEFKGPYLRAMSDERASAKSQALTPHSGVIFGSDRTESVRWDRSLNICGNRDPIRQCVQDPMGVDGQGKFIWSRVKDGIDAGSVWYQ